MEILIAVASILALTGLTRIWNSVFRFKICPICAGVSGTWIWMLVLYFSNYSNSWLYLDPWIIALLMGGSVVGISYVLAKRVPARLDLVWKTTFIILGFAAAYELLTQNFAYFAVLFILAAGASWFFALRKSTRKENSKVEQIKKGLENCC